MSLVADGPLIQVCGRVGIETGERLRDGPDDLLRTDDADVEVRQQAQRATTLTRTGIEHDRAGLGDRDGTAGDDAVESVEIGRGQAAARHPGRATTVAAAASHADGRSAGTAMRPAPWPASTAATTPGRPAVVVRWTVAR